MDSYIGWLAAAMTVGILYIFSGSGSSRLRKRRKAEKKREKKYAAIVAQLHRTDKDREYEEIRGRIEKEIDRDSDPDKRGILAKRLYGLKAWEERQEKEIIIANGISIPLIVVYISSVNTFFAEYIAYTSFFGLLFLIIYGSGICMAIYRRIDFSKLIYIMEDMLSEMDSSDKERQETAVAEDLEDLISRLKEN